MEEAAKKQKHIDIIIENGRKIILKKSSNYRRRKTGTMSTMIGCRDNKKITIYQVINNDKKNTSTAMLIQQLWN